MEATVKQMGMEMKVKVLENKINQKIDDSIFEKPEIEKVKKKIKTVAPLKRSAE